LIEVNWVLFVGIPVFLDNLTYKDCE